MTKPWHGLAVAVAVAAFMLVTFITPGLSARLSPFHQAIDEGRVDAVRAFLDQGASVDAPADNGGNGLSIALLNQDWRIAELLVERGANANARPRGNSLLLDMVYANNRESYEWLLRHGAKRDKDAEGLLKTPERKWR